MIVSDLCVFRSGSQVIRKISVNISGKGLVLVVGNNGSGKVRFTIKLRKLIRIDIFVTCHDEGA